jgi:hypothetical protein
MSEYRRRAHSAALGRGLAEAAISRYFGSEVEIPSPSACLRSFRAGSNVAKSAPFRIGYPASWYAPSQNAACVDGRLVLELTQ